MSKDHTINRHDPVKTKRGRWVDTVYRHRDGTAASVTGSFYTWEEYEKLKKGGRIKGGVIEGGRTSCPR